MPPAVIISLIFLLVIAIPIVWYLGKLAASMFKAGRLAAGDERSGERESFDALRQEASAAAERTLAAEKRSQRQSGKSQRGGRRPAAAGSASRTKSEDAEIKKALADLESKVTGPDGVKITPGTPRNSQRTEDAEHRTARAPRDPGSGASRGGA